MKTKLTALWLLFFLLTQNTFLIAHAQGLYFGPAPIVPSRSPDSNEKTVLELVDVPDSETDTARSNVAAAQPLSNERLQELSALLPAAKGGNAEQPFKPISNSRMPPPRANVKEQDFPPKSKPQALHKSEKVVNRALTVLRVSTRGPLESVAAVSVKFSLPMVNLGAPEELDKFTPVTLSPQPAGKWRWIDTQTIEFSAEKKKLPNATHYKIVVPAQTRSAVGSQLQKTYSSTFSTAPARVESFDYIKSGSDGYADSLSPLLIFRFNQSIDQIQAASLVSLKNTSGTAPDQNLVALRLASQEEINRSKYAFKKSEFSSYLFLAPRTKLAKGKIYQVAVDAGVASREGQDRSRERQRFELKTFVPLRPVLENSKGTSFFSVMSNGGYLQFTNNLDEEICDASMISIKPAVKNFKADIENYSVSLRGEFKPNVNYELLLSPKLRDVFGQQLVGPLSVRTRVKLREPQLYTSGDCIGQFVPGKKPVYHVFTYNELETTISIFQVKPSDYMTFANAFKEADRFPPKVTSTNRFKLLYKHTFATGSYPEQWHDTAVDLRELFKASPHLVALVQATNKSKEYQLQTAVQWLELSPVRTTVFNDSKNLTIYASEIASGKAIQNAQLTLMPGAAKATTDKNGLARLPLSDGGQEVILCNDGKQTTVMAHNGGWQYHDSKGNYILYGNTDRNCYRPGETVQLNGIVRYRDLLKGGVLTLSNLKFVNYAIKSSNGNELAKGTVKLDEHGVFHFECQLPAAVQLGSARVEFTNPLGKTEDLGIGEINFSIEEFRRPEFEVKTTATKSSIVVSEYTTLTAAGLYRSGSTMPKSKVHWQVSPEYSDFTSVNHVGYVFGDKIDYEVSGEDDSIVKLDSVAGATGVDTVKVRCRSLDRSSPIRLVASATVQDFSRQEWTSTTELQVHPALVYAGIKSRSAFMRSKTPKVFDFVVCDWEGKQQSDYSIHATASIFEQKKKTHEAQEKVLQSFDLTSSSQSPVSCAFDFKEIGTYYIKAQIKDKDGRLSTTRLIVEVRSDDYVPAGEMFAHGESDHPLLLKLNKEHYAPEDVAEISVQAPFASGQGIIVARKDLIQEVVPFQVSNFTAKVSLPIRETFCPDVTLAAIAYGPNGATSAGQIECEVPIDGFELKVKAATGETFKPGDEVNLDLALQDPQGQPVAGAQVMIAVVDESILALKNFSWQNPLSTFFPTGEPYWVSAEADTPVLLNAFELKPRYTNANDDSDAAAPGAPEEAKRKSGLVPPPPPMVPSPGPSGNGAVDPRYGQSNENSGADTVTVRSDFNPLAYYNPAIITSPDGTARVNFKLPGNLTKYKVMAVAILGRNTFGVGETTFTSNLPLMVRPAAPRFLNYMDQFEVPFLVQNTTDKPVQAELICRANNLTEIAPAATIAPYLVGRAFVVPPNDRVEIRLPATATSIGRADFQVGAFSGTASDAVEFSLPIQAPVAAESFATYGQIDQGVVAQPIAVPNALDSIGGLEVTTSSTAMQQLFDAAGYLKKYPYDCSEQISARMLGLNALDDLSTQFKDAANLDKRATKDLLAQDVSELCKRQQADGGFGLWARSDSTKYPFVSIQCARALFECTKRDIAVPKMVLEQALSYLRSVDSHIPKEYAREERQALKAFALNVRYHMGDSDSAKARKLVTDAEGNLNLETMAWLLPVLAHDKTHTTETQLVEQAISQHINETAGTANVVDTAYGEQSYLLYYSPTRLNAVTLESLILVTPDDAIIPKLAKGLLEQRRNGAWTSTQENSSSLLALSRYFAVFEKADPNFVARFWLGEAVSYEQKYVGRSLDSNEVKIPMDYLQKHAEDNLVILAKEGIGRLYYRVGMKYVPPDLKVPAAARGFTIERTYIPVDDKSDVIKDADGTWHIKPGATVKVVIKVVAPGVRYHVALTDPLPAGFESINTALVGSRTPQPGAASPTVDPYALFSPPPSPPPPPGSEEVSDDAATSSDTGDQTSPLGVGEWKAVWFEHENLRDNQVEVFTTLLPNGQFEYEYFAHATTPGTFIAPPCRVEEMYAPETFGRTATETVVIR